MQRHVFVLKQRQESHWFWWCLIIISSDGGANHALADKNDPTVHTRHLDGVIKKNKTGLIVIHWATDAPSGGMGELHPQNADRMMEWIGAVYYWVDRAKSPKSSWTWKYPVLDLKVDKEHPISNGVAGSFRLQDEYYFNFFTAADGRNPGSDKLTFLHTANAPSHSSDMNNKDNWRDQACYWSFTRKDGGRSVAMTSAHMWHTWANPNLFGHSDSSRVRFADPGLKEGRNAPQPSYVFGCQAG